MSSPSPNERPAPRETVDAPAAHESPVAEGALDAAVRATLAATSADERVTPEEVKALCEAARRLGPRPLELEPVAVDLVEAIINANYGHLRRDADLWRSTAAKIAALLFESPASRARLDNLWNRLVESHGSRNDA